MKLKKETKKEIESCVKKLMDKGRTSGKVEIDISHESIYTLGSNIPEHFLTKVRGIIYINLTEKDLVIE